MTPPDTATAAGIQDAARHLAEGRAAEAATVLERLVREFPAYVTAHVLLAKAMEASGRPAEALAAWHDAYFLMPGSPLVVRERARLLRAETDRPHPAEADPHEETDHPQPEMDDPYEQIVHPHEEMDHPHEGMAYPHSGEAHPHVETIPPQSEAEAMGEAEPERREPSEALGAEPDAWTMDVMPDAAPPHEYAAPPDQADDDWTILEETETPRPSSDAVTEPPVAPPPGHRPARPFTHGSASTEPRSEHEPRDDTPEADDLDTLIEQLENAPRLRPDPAFNDDALEDADADAGEVVSETLARIYEAQKQYGEAARAYEQLAEQRPGRATELLSKAAEMRRRAAESGPQG